MVEQQEINTQKDFSSHFYAENHKLLASVSAKVVNFALANVCG